MRKKLQSCHSLIHNKKQAKHTGKQLSDSSENQTDVENQSLQGAETDAGAMVARNEESLEAPCGELKTTGAHFSGVSFLGRTPTTRFLL